MALFSTPLFNFVRSGQGQGVAVPPSVKSEALLRWHKKGSTDEGIVVLLQVLPHSINAGYGGDSVRILRCVNGKNVTRLSDLLEQVCCACKTGEQFLRFTFEEDNNNIPTEIPEHPGIVLE